MKISIAALIVSITPLLALAQEDARDTVREMGGGPTSVSPGADVTGAHRDTENVGRVQQRLPNTLESAQAATSKGPSKKLNKKETQILLQQRALLVQERKAAGDAAANQVKEAPQPSPAPKSIRALQETTAQKARSSAEQDWDSKHGDDLRRINRTLKASPEKGTSERESVLPLRLPR